MPFYFVRLNNTADDLQSAYYQNVDQFKHDQVDISASLEYVLQTQLKEADLREFLGRRETGPNFGSQIIIKKMTPRTARDTSPRILEILQRRSKRFLNVVLSGE